MSAPVASRNACSAVAAFRCAPSYPLFATLIRPLIRTTSDTTQTRRRIYPNGFTPTKLPARSFCQSITRLAKVRAAEGRPNAWDEEIPAVRVRVLNQVTKELDPPRKLNFILYKMNRKDNRLVCLQNIPANVDPEKWEPTCAIMSRSEAYERQKVTLAKQKAIKKGGCATVKTIEINWAISENDLSIRLDRLETFLLEGKRVEIIFAKKKGSRRATAGEAEHVLGVVKERIEGVKGAKKVKEMEGNVLQVAKMLIQGPRPAIDPVTDQTKGKGGAQSEQ